MKSKFVIVSVIFASFLAFGYLYQQHYYPAGKMVSADAALAKAKACTEAFEKIQTRPSCEAKLTEFQTYYPDCNDQSVSYREEVFSYNDYYFELVDCFVAEGKDQQAADLLHKIEKIPSWQRLGPTDCSPKQETRARLEALNFGTNTCIKESDLQAWVGTSPELTQGLLRELSAKNHTLSCGTYNSDDICFCALEVIGRVTGASRKLLVTEIETVENNRKQVHLVNSETGKKELILEMSRENGCLFLSAVYADSGL